MQSFESIDNRKPNNHFWGFVDMLNASVGRSCA